MQANKNGHNFYFPSLSHLLHRANKNVIYVVYKKKEEIFK